MKSPIHSEHQRTKAIAEYVEQQALSDAVLACLLPANRALEDESDLWDYKLAHPDWDLLKSKESSSRFRFKAEEAELIKDCVAFYNSYGGFIVFGVDDKRRNVIGVSGSFDTDELKKQIKAYTRTYIDTKYRTFRVFEGGQTLSVGILCIPKRPYKEPPLQFVKNPPQNEKGKRAFSKDDIYLRRDCQCRPFQDAADMVFLVETDGRELFSLADSRAISLLPNNLPSRDPGLIDFVGRKSYIDKLTHWFIDSFDNLKLLVGVGGVGKTAIAREFSEILVHSAPASYETLIWLSAKKQFYAAMQDELVDNTRVDFSDPISCLTAILAELGYGADNIDPEWEERELVREIVSASRELPAVIVVDDIDSLDVDPQYELFNALQRIATLNQDSAPFPTKILITSRLDLAASPAMTLSVEGMERPEFAEYVRLVAHELRIEDTSITARQIKDLFLASEGSPLFAYSILRLTALGEGFDTAIDAWKRKDGRDVRRFAFERELAALGGEGASVLYAACTLSNPTLSTIGELLRIPRSRLRDLIGELRRFHLITQRGTESGSYTVLRIPETVQLMADILAKRCGEARRIEGRARKINAEVKRLAAKKNTGVLVAEITTLWRAERPREALNLAMEALHDDEDNRDIRSLVGRSLLKIIPPDPEEAEKHLERAFDLGNHRLETLEDWIQCKVLRKDWRGLAGLARRVGEQIGSANSAWYEAFAVAKMAERRRSERKISDAAQRYREAGDIIKRVLDKDRGHGRTKDLIDLKNTCFENYVVMLEQANRAPGDYHIVWDGVVDALDAKARNPKLISLGLEKLGSWVEFIVKKPYNEATAEELEFQLGRLRTLLTSGEMPSRNEDEAEALLNALERQVRRYQNLPR